MNFEAPPKPFGRMGKRPNPVYQAEREALRANPGQSIRVYKIDLDPDRGKSLRKVQAERTSLVLTHFPTTEFAVHQRTSYSDGIRGIWVHFGDCSEADC